MRQELQSLSRHTGPADTFLCITCTDPSNFLPFTAALTLLAGQRTNVIGPVKNNNASTYLEAKVFAGARQTVQYGVARRADLAVCHHQDVRLQHSCSLRLYCISVIYSLAAMHTQDVLPWHND